MIKLPQLSSVLNYADIRDNAQNLLFRGAPKNARNVSADVLKEYARQIVRAGNAWPHFVHVLNRVLKENPPPHTNIGCEEAERYDVRNEKSDCLRCEIDRLLKWAEERRS